MLRLNYIMVVLYCQVLKIYIVYTKNVVVLFLLLILFLKEINKYNNKYLKRSYNFQSYNYFYFLYLIQTYTKNKDNLKYY